MKKKFGLITSLLSATVITLSAGIATLTATAATDPDTPISTASFVTMDDSTVVNVVANDRKTGAAGSVTHTGLLVEPKDTTVGYSGQFYGAFTGDTKIEYVFPGLSDGATNYKTNTKTPSGHFVFKIANALDTTEYFEIGTRNSQTANTTAMYVTYNAQYRSREYSGGAMLNAPGNERYYNLFGNDDHAFNNGDTTMSASYIDLRWEEGKLGIYTYANRYKAEVLIAQFDGTYSESATNVGFVKDTAWGLPTLDWESYVISFEAKNNITNEEGKAVVTATKSQVESVPVTPVKFKKITNTPTTGTEEMVSLANDQLFPPNWYLAYENLKASLDSIVDIALEDDATYASTYDVNDELTVLPASYWYLSDTATTYPVESIKLYKGASDNEDNLFADLTSVSKYTLKTAGEYTVKYTALLAGGVEGNEKTATFTVNGETASTDAFSYKDLITVNAKVKVADTKTGAQGKATHTGLLIEPKDSTTEYSGTINATFTGDTKLEYIFPGATKESGNYRRNESTEQGHFIFRVANAANAAQYFEIGTRASASANQAAMYVYYNGQYRSIEYSGSKMMNAPGNERNYNAFGNDDHAFTTTKDASINSSYISLRWVEGKLGVYTYSGHNDVELLIAQFDGTYDASATNVGFNKDTGAWGLPTLDWANYVITFEAKNNVKNVDGKVITQTNAQKDSVAVTPIKFKKITSNGVAVDLSATGAESAPNWFSVIPTIKAANLSLSTDLAIKYYVPVDALGDYTDLYISANYMGKDYKLENATEANIGDVEYKVFTFYGVSPDKMAEKVMATLYAKKATDAEYTVFDEVEYSVQQYCLNKLNSTDASTELKTLCKKILNYGAAAQVYNNYKADELVNADVLTVGEKKLNAEALNLQSAYAISESGNDSVAVWKGANLYFSNKISLKFYFSATEITGATATVICGEAEGVDVAITTEQVGEETYYCVTFDQMTAIDLGKTVQVKITNGENESKVLTYSVETYAYNKQASQTPGLSDLVISMMEYIKAVEAYAAV